MTSPVLTAAEYRAQPKAKRNKYRARKTEVDGITFDSALEAKYYANLKLLEKAGAVYGVELQKRYALVGPDGSLITTYIADFVFWDQRAKHLRIVDVKGVKTREFVIKKKLMKSLLGLDVEVVGKV